MTPDTAAAWLIFIFIGIPLIALAVRVAWLALRIAAILAIWLLGVMGAAWRGEL
jgi:hypothetical protein